MILLAVLGLAACTDKQEKTLVLYYSQTGATKAVAEEIKAQLGEGVDIEAIELENPYDNDFQATINRAKDEMENGTLPALKPLKSKLNDYDVIFLGYPVWFGTYALPIESLLKTESFEGKKVVTFCTFGSGGLQSSTKNLKEALPKAEVIEGYGVRNARKEAVKDELNRFLIERGFKAGEVEALPAFAQHHPVEEMEYAIFDQACLNYQFPLGTPVSVASRETPTGTDYEYTVKSADQDGVEQTTTIYVTVGKEEGAQAEFTQVIR